MLQLRDGLTKSAKRQGLCVPFVSRQFQGRYKGQAWQNQGQVLETKGLQTRIQKGTGTIVALNVEAMLRVS